MAQTTGPILRATGILKRFGHVHALSGADLEVQPGEIHALLGDNGAGKSTLVKVIAGVLTPDAGSIELDGQPVRFSSPRDAQQAGIETVYQDLALAPTLPPGENVFLGRERKLNGPLGRLGFVDHRYMREQTAREMALLGVELRSISVPVSSLSGGQRQAVALARALVWGSRLVIMDEPTAALGPRQTRLVLDLMRKVRDERHVSILVISHNLPDVFEVADRVSVMRLGERVLTAPIADVTTNSLLAAMTGAEEVRR